jgi:hypothetical protein
MQEGYLSAQHIVLTLRGKWDLRMTLWLAGRGYLLRRDDRDGPKSGIGRSTSGVLFADVAEYTVFISAARPPMCTQTGGVLTFRRQVIP